MVARSPLGERRTPVSERRRTSGRLAADHQLSLFLGRRARRRSLGFGGEERRGVKEK
jgi:hypothetical protein